MSYQRYITEKINEIITHGGDSKTILTMAMVAIHESHDAFYWVGIYRLFGDTLRLGPFSGPATEHKEIPVGRGVCGTAVLEDKDQVISDVSAVDNYLACNLSTRSELVSLIRDPGGTILGQIDIDATQQDFFKAEDAEFFSALGQRLWPYMN